MVGLDDGVLVGVAVGIRVVGPNVGPGVGSFVKPRFPKSRPDGGGVVSVERGLSTATTGGSPQITLKQVNSIPKYAQSLRLVQGTALRQFTEVSKKSVPQREVLVNVGGETTVSPSIGLEIETEDDMVDGDSDGFRLGGGVGQTTPVRK